MFTLYNLICFGTSKQPTLMQMQIFNDTTKIYLNLLPLKRSSDIKNTQSEFAIFKKEVKKLIFPLTTL